MALMMFRRLALVALLLLLAVSPADLTSCGPFFPVAIFTRMEGPDNDAAFSGGQLGILRSTYALRYLVIAYRELTGVPLDANEIAGAARGEPKATGDGDTMDASNAWRTARNQVPGVSQISFIYPYRQMPPPAYWQYLNCGDDAFRHAAKTLDDHIGQTGAASSEVRDWLAAQDMVFQNCSAGPAIPPPAPPSATAREKADRAYQIAAANFYAARLDDATIQFRNIALDTSSPWRALAAYLVARVDARRKDFAASHADLERVLANPQFKEMHPAAQSYLRWVEFQQDPARRMGMLSKRLMQPDSDTYAQDLSDFTYLYSNIERQPFLLKAKWANPDFRNAAAQDDLTGWLFAFHGYQTLAYADVLARWRQRKTLPWLIAALQYSPVHDPALSELLAAAERVSPASPAYATLRYQEIRILEYNGSSRKVRALLDEVLRRRLPPSARNAFRAERMSLARSFAEFLDLAPRAIAAEGNENPPHEISVNRADQKAPAMFDLDAAQTFNTRLPLSFWLRAVRDQKLAAPLRTELAQAGWVRAMMLHDPAENAFRNELAQLKPNYANELNGTAGSPAEARRFSTVFWMLHHPELQPWIRSGFQRATPDRKIDDYRDNWWCDLDGRQGGTFYNFYAFQTGANLITSPPQPPRQYPAPFLTPAENRQAAAQADGLVKSGSAPTFLSAAVVGWARSHPRDPRDAEALALAVKTSRLGCTDGQSARYVSQAFHLLHERYPHSAWARETKFWYK